MLQPSDVISILVLRRLIRKRLFVDGRVDIENVSRRNHNFRVVVKDGPSFLLKEGLDEERGRSIAHEAETYRYLHAQRGTPGLREFLPALCASDAERNFLITRLPRQGRSLTQDILGTGRFSRTGMRQLGTAMALLHRMTVPEAHSGTKAGAFSGWYPWVRQLYAPEVGEFREFTHAAVEMVTIVQQADELCERIDEACASWRHGACLIHSDVKFDNLVVIPVPGRARSARLFLTDWEHAALGDPAWDVGSVFCECLVWWLYAIPIVRAVPPRSVMESIRFPLARIQPAARAFWHNYRSSSGLDDSNLRKRLLRAVRLSAVRMLQTAFERMQAAARIDANTVCLLQLSLNVLRRPEEALAQLLGITPFSTRETLNRRERSQ